MAKFGQNFIQSLTNPGYSQGMFELGSALGQAPAKAKEKKAKQGMLKDLQEALISNDPNVIEAKGTALLETKPELGAKLIARARGLRTTAQEGRISRGLQGGLTAIQAAATRGVPLADLKEAQQSVISLGGTQDQISDAYKAGIPEVAETPNLNFSTQTIVNEDGDEVVIQTVSDPKNGKIIRQNTLGDAVVRGRTAQDKQTLNDIAKDRGILPDENGEYTVEQYRKLRTIAQVDLNNATLANGFTDDINRLTDSTVTESLGAIRRASPAMEKNEELLEQSERYAALDALSGESIAGLAALLERTLTSTTENDLRAVAELERFRGSKDLASRISDGLSMFAVGSLSDDTLKDYRTIMTGLEKLAKNRIGTSIDRYVMSATSEREMQEAATARAFYGIDDEGSVGNE